MHKKNTFGFSIVLAMLLTTILGLLTFYLLDYIIPFGRSIKGVENSTKAYYEAVGGLEDAIMYVGTGGIGAQNSVAFSGTPVENSYAVSSLSRFHPVAGTGNSPFDSNWGIIAPGYPIQIYLPTGITMSSVYVYFRVPNVDNNTTTSEYFYASDLLEKDIINWQMISPADTLNSHPTSPTYPNNRVQESNISTSNGTPVRFRIDLLDGFNLSDGTQTLPNFYTTNCTSNYQCLLKFSIVNDIVIRSSIAPTISKKIPFLEYRIQFPLGTLVPQHTITIDAGGKSYGYRKDLRINFPQRGTLEAFDFTIFQ